MALRPRIWLSLLIVVTVVVGGASGVGAQDPLAAQEQPTSDPTEVTMAIQLATNGTARWNVTARFVLTTENETEAFRSLAAEFEAGEAGPSIATFEALADRAAERVDRSTRIGGVDRSWRIRGSPPSAVGELSLTFTWTNFAQAGEQRILVGDVFDAWTLGRNQQLVIYPPENYGLQSAEPGTDGIQSGGPVWNGPTAFGEGQPSITYEAGVTPPDGDGNGVPDPDVFVAIGMIALAGAMVALAIAVWRRRPGPLPDAADDVEPAGIPPESASAAEPPQPADPESVEESEPAGAATVDPELLSDEERVEHLLEANDGRMRQADIVTETGWSNAKVSQLLSGMAEEGRVEKLRMGRENLISLPDAEETEE